jgi:bis(5'-nucleosyl)-tetraphosphatase (symmetrical)
MAVFAIGDIQGCYDDLMRLLERIHFDQGEDRLWFAGDLVNRGPDSLKVLRFVKDLGESAVSVLGNHDLHLLAVASGATSPRKKDTLDGILASPHRDEYLDWLRHRPLLHHDATLGYTMVHAGLPPQWDLEQARSCAHELESVLRGSAHLDFFGHMYGDEPRCWDPGLQGMERLRFIVNCFTRLRYCSKAGDLEFKSKGAPGTQPEGYLPWFEVPGRASAGLHLLFGHWSTLGDISSHNVYPLDTGCIWGGRLTALRLDGDGSDSWYCVDCKGQQAPDGD